MRSVRIALVSGFLVLLAALAVALSRAPASVARLNTPQEENLGYNEQGLVACQSGELLPAHTTALRLRLGAFTGPAIRVEALQGTRVIARGEQGAGWTGRSITVALEHSPPRSTVVKLCFGWALHGSESVSVYGERTGPAQAARLDNGSPALGRVGIEYLRPGQSSWLSLARSVARRMGLGRAAAGTWIALLALALMAGVLLLSTQLLLREMR